MLAKWRAHDADDFGLMLLEMWAYVCDVVAFNDQALANESYLRTAVLPSSLRRLVAMIGYLPRPELASVTDLGALVEGRVPVAIPAGTAFRSAAFGSEPPQVFETSADAIAHPDANQWTVVPPRAATLSGNARATSCWRRRDRSGAARQPALARARRRREARCPYRPASAQRPCRP